MPRNFSPSFLMCGKKRLLWEKSEETKWRGLLPRETTRGKNLQVKVRKRCCGRRIWLAYPAIFGDLDSGGSSPSEQVHCTSPRAPALQLLMQVNGLQNPGARLFQRPVLFRLPESKWRRSHPQSGPRLFPLLYPPLRTLSVTSSRRILHPQVSLIKALQ